MFHIRQIPYLYNNLCPFSGLPVDWQGEPHIAINPKPDTVQLGTKLSLRCAAFGIPTPHYQWYRNGQPLLDKTSDILQVRQENKGLLIMLLITIAQV